MAITMQKKKSKLFLTVLLSVIRKFGHKYLWLGVVTVGTPSKSLLSQANTQYFMLFHPE